MTDISDQQLVDIYRTTRSIAVVGASTNPDKPAHSIPAYLQSQGYRIIPVNPSGGEILGEPTASSLQGIDEAVDVVNVFRPSEEAPDIARTAVEIGARTLWLQVGIEHEEAARIARDGGLAVVMDTCMGATHKRMKRDGLL